MSPHFSIAFCQSCPSKQAVPIDGVLPVIKGVFHFFSRNLCFSFFWLYSQARFSEPVFFYSDGEIVSRQHSQYIGAFPESEVVNEP